MIPALLVPSVRPKYGIIGTLANAPGTTSQLVLRAYLIGGGFTVVSSGVVWASATPTVATVNSSGLVTFVGPGTSVISATYQGVTAQNTATTQDELAWLRANLSGGDSAMLATYSVRQGLNVSGSNVTGWDDLRGSGGFGPSLSPTGTVTRTGSSTSDWRVHTGSGASGIASALTSLFDISSPKAIAIVYGGRQAGFAPGDSWFAAILEGNVGSPPPQLGITPVLNGNPVIGGWENAGSNMLQSPATHTARLRTIIVSLNAGTLKIWVGQNLVTSMSVTPPASGTVRLALGRLLAGPFGAPGDYRGALVLPREPTTADVLAVGQWGQIYHSSVDYSPFLCITDGDSNTSGLGLTDSSTRWGSVLFENSEFAAWADVNPGHGSAEVRSGGAFSRIDQLPTLLAMFANAGSTKGIVLLGGGCGDNDIANATQTGAATATAIFAYADAVRAAGKKVIIGSTLPRDTSGAPSGQVFYNAEAANCDTALAAGWTSHADAYVNHRLLTPFNITGAYSNLTYYQADGVHLAPAGHAALASAYKPVVLAL